MIKFKEKLFNMSLEQYINYVKNALDLKLKLKARYVITLYRFLKRNRKRNLQLNFTAK